MELDPRRQPIPRCQWKIGYFNRLLLLSQCSHRHPKSQWPWTALGLSAVRTESVVDVTEVQANVAVKTRVHYGPNVQVCNVCWRHDSFETVPVAWSLDNRIVPRVPSKPKWASGVVKVAEQQDRIHIPNRSYWRVHKSSNCKRRRAHNIWSVRSAKAVSVQCSKYLTLQSWRWGSVAKFKDSRSSSSCSGRSRCSPSRSCRTIPVPVLSILVGTVVSVRRSRNLDSGRSDIANANWSRSPGSRSGRSGLWLLIRGQLVLSLALWVLASGEPGAVFNFKNIIALNFVKGLELWERSGGSRSWSSCRSRSCSGCRSTSCGSCGGSTSSGCSGRSISWWQRRKWLCKVLRSWRETWNHIWYH